MTGDVQQIYNVYSLGLAILSVVFLQWLLLYQRGHEEPTDSVDKMSEFDLTNEAARPDSPEILLPSITVVPPSPCSSDHESDDAETAEVESTSSPAAADKPAVSDAGDNANDDDPGEVLPAPDPASRPRRPSEVSVAVLQMINEQRRFSVSAASAKSASKGGVTG